MTVGFRVLALTLLVSACRHQDVQVSERWAADFNLGTTSMVLFMTFVRDDGDVSGTGLLSALNQVGGESLTLSGTRRADTLDLTYQRIAGAPFRFVGLYTAAGTLSGTLDGAEFTQKQVSFRSR